MPTSYNGIGTHYYGKKNKQTRHGVCQQCNRQVELASYDTRLWFVIIFIPIMPLGRKRILDECPACSRHYSLELQKWETSKQLEISGALDKYRTNPTPETAIETHQTLVNYHQAAEAAEFRQMMRSKYADNARVHAYLGVVLEALGQFDDAATAFQRAFELRPDMPEARVGVSHVHLRAKRLDDAWALLDFLEKPGASQLYSLEPIETLALALQADGRHEEALRLFAHLLAEIPPLGQHTDFRKSILKSEKALKRATSVLPKHKFSWKRFFGNDPTSAATGETRLTWKHAAWAGGIGAFILLMGVIRNEHVRRHRTLHIVNALPQAAVVNVRGVGEVRVGAGTEQLVLAEGRHHVRISGPLTEEFDFDVRTGFFDRWFEDPMWIINVGGAAVLARSKVVYSANPPPAEYSLHFGQPIEFFDHVTHPFTTLPESLRMKSGESRTLTQLEIVSGKPIGTFNYLVGKSQVHDALRFAELQLGFNPDDDEILYSYIGAARGQRQIARAEQYLRKGMSQRPVRIAWHRAFHSLKKDQARDAQLLTEYDVQLQAEPGNSALLYLRGRLTPGRDDAVRYFERAKAADLNNPYPHYALGHDRATRGDWATARPHFAEAARLGTNDLAFAHSFSVARMALAEHDALEQECRETLKREPFSFQNVTRLCDILVAAGKNQAAKDALTAFERAASARYGTDAQELNQQLRRHLMYVTGDFAELEKDAGRDRAPGSRMAKFHALLEQGKVAEAVASKVADSGEADDERGFLSLCVALAWAEQRNSAEATAWRERAASAMAAGDSDSALAAQLLRRTAAPTLAELDAVLLQSAFKALLLANLAHMHPAHYQDFATIARRLNVPRAFPHHLVQRTTAGVP